MVATTTAGLLVGKTGSASHSNSQVRTMFHIHVWGPTALFVNPHLAADPYSYDVPTPSAAMSLVRALRPFGKPELAVEIREIHVCRRILRQTTQIKSLKAWVTREDTQADTTRTLQTASVLRDVEYVFGFDIHVNPHRATRTLHDYTQECAKRLQAGQEWTQPFLGRREYAASWEYLPPGAPRPAAIQETRDLGRMLFDNFPVDLSQDRFESRFYNAHMEKGVITVPNTLYATYRDSTFRLRHAVTPIHPTHLSR